MEVNTDRLNRLYGQDDHRGRGGDERIAGSAGRQARLTSTARSPPKGQ